MVPDEDLERRIAGIAALDQPIRRDLYRLLGLAGGWTSRDDAAAALSVPRSVAAFHLDKLVDAGVVVVRFERLTGRRGPGAGRPTKLYRPSTDAVTASVPERNYDLAGSMLATAIDDAARTGRPVRECLAIVARAVGQEVGRAANAAAGDSKSSRDGRPSLVTILARSGYEPEVDADDEIVLTNCPFHRLAVDHVDLVCGMNLDMIDGVLVGLDQTDAWKARLAPSPGKCCVRIVPC